MAFTGKIKTLFEDKDMNSPIFPRTKTRAVSDDNGIGLDAILDTIVYTQDYDIDTTAVPLNADTLDGHSIDSLMNKIYPVGAVYVSSTNTNPSTLFGGTWTLTGKGFKDSIGSDSNLFTASNCSAHGVNYSRSGSTLNIKLNFTNSSALTDTTLSLGTLNFNGLGITQLPYTIHYAIGTSDGGNVIIMVMINYTTGEVSVVDIVGADSMSASSSYVNLTIPCHYSHMLDSFCDKFYWKRTA